MNWARKNMDECVSRRGQKNHHKIAQSTSFNKVLFSKNDVELISSVVWPNFAATNDMIILFRTFRWTNILGNTNFRGFSRSPQRFNVVVFSYLNNSSLLFFDVTIDIPYYTVYDRTIVPFPPIWRALRSIHGTQLRTRKLNCTSKLSFWATFSRRVKQALLSVTTVPAA